MLLLPKRVIYGAQMWRVLKLARVFAAKPHNRFNRTSTVFEGYRSIFTDQSVSDENIDKNRKLEIPQRIRQKVISAADAVSLVNDGDTVCVSGFVTQGAPEAVLVALGERYKQTNSPSNLTLLFGGGPGDYDKRGLNHLAQLPSEGSNRPPMLKRTIGSHYGQTPMVARLALEEKTEAWTLPLGSVSRMLRAQSTHSPGHITTVGLGTYVDPDISGGAANESAKNSPFHKELVTKMNLGGRNFLMYKALPVNVAIIRGTTADIQGNISIEHESLLCDQMITAAAARNSGGIVIAQVKRIAAKGSLPSRSIAVPGPLVDCIVVVDEKDHDEQHPMSFVERSNPILTGEFRTPQDQLPKMELDIRKIIARRAFFGLRPNTVVNLGIGLPEGVASIAAEEEMLSYVTLSTEPGSFGGIPASGHSFGPSFNADALIEMNQMFDFYDGGGLDICFLGAAEVSINGDVNVSRMSKNRLTGPGGFIDISQSTKNIYFMTPFTAKGLELGITGDGTLKITKEGKVKKFVSNVFEKTFSGEEAVRRGQSVFYITERAVLRRSAHHEVLELVEIAPGIDLQKDILDQMEFLPVVSQDLKIMDPKIFKADKMNARSHLFGSLGEHTTYHEDDHTIFIDLFGITIDGEDDIGWFTRSLSLILEPLVEKKGPIAVVVNYDGFDIRKDLEEKLTLALEVMSKKYYKSVRRFAGKAFKRAKLGRHLSIGNWDIDNIYNQFNRQKKSDLSMEDFRDGMIQEFHIHLTPIQLKTIADKYRGESDSKLVKLDKASFEDALLYILKSK
jgi:propionate CoA-transferase